MATSEGIINGLKAALQAAAGREATLQAALQAAQEREAILRAALAEYANADNWAYRTECGIGPNVARAALEQAAWQAVPV
jgi:hypothetical protein